MHTLTTPVYSNPVPLLRPLCPVLLHYFIYVSCISTSNIHYVRTCFILFLSRFIASPFYTRTHTHVWMTLMNSTSAWTSILNLPPSHATNRSFCCFDSFSLCFAHSQIFFQSPPRHTLATKCPTHDMLLHQSD